MKRVKIERATFFSRALRVSKDFLEKCFARANVAQIVRTAAQQPDVRSLIAGRSALLSYGRGGGVGRGLGGGLDRGVGVGRGVAVAVAVTVAVGVGEIVAVAVAVGIGLTVAVAVAVAVGVGVGVAPPTGAWMATIIGEPVLKNPTVALDASGG